MSDGYGALTITDATDITGRIAMYGGICPVCGQTATVTVHTYSDGRMDAVRCYHAAGSDARWCVSPPPDTPPPSCAYLAAIGGAV